MRGEAENAAVAAAAATAAGENPAEPVLAAPAHPSPQVRASLLRVLGRIAHASALPILYQSAQDADADVKDAAIPRWPNGRQATREGVAGDRGRRRGFSSASRAGPAGLRQHDPQTADATDDQILDNYAKPLQLAGRNEEKQLVLSKLGLVRHRRALEMARQQAGDPALKQSAEAAVQNIEKLLAAPARVTASHNPDKANNAIDKDPNTRWDTGGAQQGGEWFRIELDEERLIAGLVLDTRGSGGDYLAGTIYVSPSSLATDNWSSKAKATRR